MVIDLSAVPLDHLSDGELMAAWCQSRDENALAALIRKHRPMVLAVCRRQLRERGLSSEEVTDEVLWILCERLDQVQRPEALGAWLHGVARRRCAERIRTCARRERRLPSLASELQASPDADLERQEERTRLRLALLAGIEELPSGQRQAIERFYFQGQDLASIAGELDLSIDAVKNRLHHGRINLRRSLGRQGVVGATAGMGLLLHGGWASLDELRDAVVRELLVQGQSLLSRRWRPSPKLLLRIAGQALLGWDPLLAWRALRMLSRLAVQLPSLRLSFG